MKNRWTSLFWILTDLLIIFAIPFFPSFFSIFCILAAIIFAPIDIWQETLNKFLKKPIKSIIIALCVAFVIAQFPITPIIAGIVRLTNPATYAPQNTSSVTYYEEHSSDLPNVSDYSNTESSSSELFTSSNESVSSTTSKNVTTSSKSNSSYSTSKKNTTSSKVVKPSSTYSPTQNNFVNQEDVSNSNMVYRTPSGKRYHNSSSCGGKNSYAVPYDDAINSGLTPCKKCVK